MTGRGNRDPDLSGSRWSLEQAAQLLDAMARDCDQVLRDLGIDPGDPARSTITPTKLKAFQLLLEDARFLAERDAPKRSEYVLNGVAMFTGAVGLGLLVSGPIGWTVASIVGATMTVVGGGGSIVATGKTINDENTAMTRLIAIERAAQAAERVAAAR